MWTQARIDELLQERNTQSPSAVLSLEAELAHTRSALAQVTAPSSLMIIQLQTTAVILLQYWKLWQTGCARWPWLHIRLPTI